LLAGRSFLSYNTPPICHEPVWRSYVLYAVLGDVHGNLQALQGVLADAESAGAERVLCVGDIVGYGADPRECLLLLQELVAVAVAGNHDCAGSDRFSVDYFNADARDSIEWTREQLSEADRDYLGALPLVEVVDEITLVHSTPFSPEYFDYIQTLYDVQLAFDHVGTCICFVGHTHVPVMFLDASPIEFFLQPEFDLPADRKVIVNVGSVGQPRDLDPRACYVLYDSEEERVSVRRVDYDLHSASARMVEAGLPSTNAARIVLGR
jgi:diadenosine tetraphosphatase ApaH/serine/threonine PP2A family protein phosphatase